MNRRSIAEFKALVVALYGEKAFRKSALNIRDGAGVFDRVLGDGRYRRVLEIGTYKGISTAYIAQFVDRVITIDLEVGKLETNGETFDRESFWANMGATNIELKLVSGYNEKAEFIRGLPVKAFDLAFIDAGKNDIADDFNLVQHCGTVLFHDYDRRGKPELDAVYNFVNALPKHEIEVLDIFALWRLGAGGWGGDD